MSGWKLFSVKRTHLLDVRTWPLRFDVTLPINRTANDGTFSFQSAANVITYVLVLYSIRN